MDSIWLASKSSKNDLFYHKRLEFVILTKFAMGAFLFATVFVLVHIEELKIS